MKTVGWAFLPEGFDRPLCPGERERDNSSTSSCAEQSKAKRESCLESRGGSDMHKPAEPRQPAISPVLVLCAWLLTRALLVLVLRCSRV